MVYCEQEIHRVIGVFWPFLQVKAFRRRFEFLKRSDDFVTSVLKFDRSFPICSDGWISVDLIGNFFVYRAF